MEHSVTETQIHLVLGNSASCAFFKRLFLVLFSGYSSLGQEWGESRAPAPGNRGVWVVLTFGLLKPSPPFPAGPLRPLASPATVAQFPFRFGPLAIREQL